MISKLIRKKINNLDKQASELLSSRGLTHGLKRSLQSFKKEVVMFNNYASATHKHINGKNLKVQIGGGKHRINGFINIDIFPPADIIFDLREKIPLASNSTELLFSEHFLEHIDYPISVKKFIKESFRVLRKGGKVIIGIPDTKRVIEAYVRKDKKTLKEYVSRWYKNRDNLEHFNTLIDIVNYHLRDQDDDEKYTPHLWGYDKEKIKSLLSGAGFKHIKDWKFNPVIANPKREFGSIYVEGKKVPLESKKSLIAYKSKLARAVDLEDVKQLQAL